MKKMAVAAAIFVDELSGRDQMGQQKPFFKILGSYQKARRGHVIKIQYFLMDFLTHSKTQIFSLESDIEGWFFDICSH